MRKTIFAAAMLPVFAADGSEGGVTNLQTPADAPADAPAPASNTVLNFELPNLDGQFSFDMATIPAETRLILLGTATRDYIRNRVNSAFQRHQKDDKVKAWAAYAEANKADPLQTAVPKPEGDEPAAADLQGALDRALADLVAGNVRRQSDEPKARVKKDPLVQMVTKAVVREVYESRKATDNQYTYIKAQQEVGADGVAYLNTLIETKVAAGADRAALEKALNTKYINPAKMMLGLTDTKASKELPSIL